MVAPLLAVVLAVAVVVLLGALIDDTLGELWWLVAAVGLVAGVTDQLLNDRTRRSSTASPAHGPPPPSDRQPVPSAQPVSFEPVSLANASRSAWGTHVSPEPSGVPAPAVALAAEPPPLSAAVARSDSTDLIGAPVNSVGLDPPNLPAPPVTAAPAPGISAPALVRVATQPAQAVWRSSALWAPKSSHDWADHEDAWAIDDTLGRAALADGASSAFMARQWAMAITTRFLDDPPVAGHGGFDRWVARATEHWASEAAAGEGSASWWAGASEQRGSYATLVGVSLEPRESDDAISFTATAVGDSCLVHLTPDDKAWRRALAFPLERPEDFGKHPELVATTGARTDGSMPVLRSACGQLRRGDALMLLSDALAEFALEIDRSGDASIWTWLMTAGQGEFCATIDKARAAEKIEDDDSTLVRILV